MLTTVCLLFASTDWIMSLEPEWFSSMFVVIVGISQLLTALAGSIALLIFLPPSAGLGALLDGKCRRDLGNLLMAMVILAATVSLRSFRSGGTQTMVITGMVGGIGFFLLTEVARQVGLSGLVSATAAAWVPIGLALLVTLTVLLHQEDG